MMGRVLHDPQGIEGPPESVPGLGLLDVETTLEPHKNLESVSGRHCPSGVPLDGYEMHIGRTEGADCARPFADIQGEPEGARSADGRAEGTYLHGLFASDGFRRAYLEALGGKGDSGLAFDHVVEATLDGLAGHLETHVDLDLLLDIARGANVRAPEHVVS